MPHVDRVFGYMALAFGQDYWMVPQITTHLLLRYFVNESSVASATRLVRHLLVKKGLESLLRVGDHSSTDENVEHRASQRAARSDSGTQHPEISASAFEIRHFRSNSSHALF